MLVEEKKATETDEITKVKNKSQSSSQAKLTQAHNSFQLCLKTRYGSACPQANIFFYTAMLASPYVPCSTIIPVIVY